MRSRATVVAIAIAAAIGLVMLVSSPAGAQTTNEPPVANDDTVAIGHDTATLLDVLANDTDPEDDTLTITSITGGSHGSVLLSGGQITYTPNSGFAGSDSFDYTISDGNAHSDTATVTLNVAAAPTGAPPTAVDDDFDVAQDTSTVLDVLANDTDADADALTITSVTAPTLGTATVADAGTRVTYVPNSGVTGDDSFDYTISDGHGNSATATVTVTVTAAMPGNPTATDDTATTAEDTVATIDVLANDTAADAGELSVASTTTPSNGAVVVNADDTVTYTPNSGFSGTDTFDYTVNEAGGGSATATVTVTVGSGGGDGEGCVDGTRVELGNGLGFCIASPNPNFMQPGQQLFPNGLFPGGLFPNGLFPNGVFGKQGGDADNGTSVTSATSSAGASSVSVGTQAGMPDLSSLGSDIRNAVHEALGR